VVWIPFDDAYFWCKDQVITSTIFKNGTVLIGLLTYQEARPYTSLVGYTWIGYAATLIISFKLVVEI